MEIVIQGTPKEIAALALALQERRVEFTTERKPYDRRCYAPRVDAK